jgi:hypothetical protein
MTGQTAVTASEGGRPSDHVAPADVVAATVALTALDRQAGPMEVSTDETPTGVDFFLRRNWKFRHSKPCRGFR